MPGTTYAERATRHQSYSRDDHERWDERLSLVAQQDAGGREAEFLVEPIDALSPEVNRAAQVGQVAGSHENRSANG